MSNSSQGTRVWTVVLVILICLPIFALAAGSVFWFYFDSPYGDPDLQSKEIVVNNGDTISSVAARLENAQLVADARYFVLRYKILSRLGLVDDYKAGRYMLASGQRPSKLLRGLTSPDDSLRVYTTITIPPGLTASEIAARIEEAGLALEEDVLKAIRLLVSEYPIKDNPGGLQGYLFPDTYRFEKPLGDLESSSQTMARSIVSLMADRFFEVLDEVDSAWSQLTPYQLHEKVTLASIVEREYRVDAEAPMIAAVFNNRLEKGMPLQSCATVVYTITDTEVGAPYLGDYLRFDRRIFERYLEIDSPYNTYYHSALPPGPISIPGRIAIEAAFYPSSTDAMFFVVEDPDAGTHIFTREYGDHLAARAAYLSQYVVKD